MMQIQTLVSCVNQDVRQLAEKMNLETDAIIINQCDENSYFEYQYEDHLIQCYSFKERGVGLSRNSALLRAKADIILFSDEDIVYEKGYATQIQKAFETHKDSDFLLFNIRVDESRATYFIEKETKISLFNSGRYPTYSFAIRREAVHKHNITFSLLFGGGAKYSNGEDSLFIKDCLKAGLKIKALPITLGEEQVRPSTWFHGYNDKYFYDRGVLYVYLYGVMAKPFAVRFVYKHKKKIEESYAGNQDKENAAMTIKRAFSMIMKGIHDTKL